MQDIFQELRRFREKVVVIAHAEALRLGYEKLAQSIVGVDLTIAEVVARTQPQVEALKLLVGAK